MPEGLIALSNRPSRFGKKLNLSVLSDFAVQNQKTSITRETCPPLLRRTTIGLLQALAGGSAANKVTKVPASPITSRCVPHYSDLFHGSIVSVLY